MATAGSYIVKSEGQNVALPMDTKNNESSSDHPVAFTYSSGEAVQSQPPPVYSEVPRYSANNDHRAPPPSYESLFGRVKSMKKESTGTLDFLKKLFAHLLGTVVVLIVLGILLALPVAMLYMGIKYLDECSKSYLIPGSLLLGGIGGVLRIIVSFVLLVKELVTNNEDEETSCCFPKFDGLMLSYPIAGGIITYINQDFTTADPSDFDYCDPTLYYFAFWLYTAFFILLGLLCCCCCAIIGYYMIKGDDD